MELIATERFAVFELSRRNFTAREHKATDGANSCRAALNSGSVAAKTPIAASAIVFKRGGEAIEIPSMRLRELNSTNASRFRGLMEKHGFVVLTETGSIRRAYVEFMELLKAFFECDSKLKESCKGAVHFNERGIPMWHIGYERCGDVREAFRLPAPFVSPPGLQKPWPCPRLRSAWLSVLRLLHRVCHRALTLTLGRPVLGAPLGAPPADDDVQKDDDFSVSYALHYPNEVADPALKEEDLTVGEHIDPSLFVAEPCCGVEGLEIRDRATGRWLPVEAVCASLGRDGSGRLAEGRELILFGGKALERATDGRVRGAPHRVRRGDHGERYCFIYEQKYAEFFPPPTLD